MATAPSSDAVILLAALACVFATGASAQETIIDNFAAGAFPAVTDDPTPGSTTQVQAGLPTADVIGGSRTLELEATANVTVSADVTPDNIRFFVPSDTVDSSGVFELRYEAGGTDLTADGSDRIIIDIFGFIVFTATLEVSLNGGASVLSHALTADSSYPFLFDDFSVPNEATSVQDLAVRLTTSGPSLQQVRMEEIRTSGPLSSFGTANVDGTKDAGEWDDAAQRDVFSGAFAGSTLYVMNDAVNLYLAIEVQGDADLTNTDRIEVRFDNGLDLLLTPNDDGYLTNSGGSDRHFDQALLGWSTVDAAQHGQDAQSRSGATNFFEIAKPLASGDSEDFDLAAGDRVGFCLVYFENDVGTTNNPVQCNLSVNDQVRYDLIDIARGPQLTPALSLWGTLALGAAVLVAGIGLSTARRPMRNATPPAPHA